MILRDAIDAYIAWRQAHGARFITSARLLHGFCKHVGGNIDCEAVGEAHVLGFLAGNGSLTRYRANKYGALAGFYRYAISRGYAPHSPLPAPDGEPRQPRSAPPYVYSRDELQRLFAAIDISRQRPVQLDADTLRALLLLLYGAGLRLGEARHLTLDDVDLRDAVLTVRNTKFYKTRLVPVGLQLTDALSTYATKRAEHRSCLGILRLAKTYSDARLEAAAQRALTLGAHSVRSVESILKHRLDEQPLHEAPDPPLPDDHDNLRDPSYFH